MSREKNLPVEADEPSIKKVKTYYIRESFIGVFCRQQMSSTSWIVKATFDVKNSTKIYIKILEQLTTHLLNRVYIN